MDTQRQDRNNEQMVKLEMRAKHLENQIAEFKQWRQDLDKMNVMMTTDRQNMEMMMSENVKHNDTLQVLKKVVMDGKDGLAVVRYELQNKMEQLDSLFGEINAQNTHVKDLNIQARKTRGDIENATQTIRLKEKEQDTKDHELKTLKEELDIKRKSVERERVELETLRSKLDKQKEELEEALTSLSGERQELSEVKTENLKAREILSTSMDRIEEQNADLKLREGQVEQKIQLIETVRSRLQKVTDVLCSNLEKKTISLQENSQGVLALGTVAQQIMSEIGKQKESLTTHRELLEREKELLKNILSDMDTQRQDRNNEQMVKLEMRAKHLENQIAEFKQWRQDLDKMNVMMTTDRQNMEMMMSENVKHNDTLQVLKKVVMDGKDGLAMVRYELQNKMEQLDSLFGEINAQNTHVKDLNIQARKTRGDIENATQTIRLKEKEQDTKDHELKTLKEELDTKDHELKTLKEELDIKRKSVERERVELETLRSKLDKQKEELEEALTSLSGERQELSEVKTENLKAREILSTSMDRIEEQNADLKLREGQVEQKIQLIETVRSRLQKVTDVLCSNLEKKTISLQENSQGVLALGTVAQQIMSEIGKQKESLTTHRELLEREKELLKNILSDMDTQRQDRNNEQMVKLEMRAKHLENQIAEFKQWRQDLDKMNVMMTTDRQNMEMMMSENVKHNDTLQVLKKVVMDGKDGLAVVRYELQNKMEQLDSLFGEINAQNTHVKDLNIQARKTRGDIENATQTIRLKEKEQDTKDHELKTLKEEPQRRT
ncbi:uncharacterized protein V6R79_024899 [Siganus canaliculatus]